MSDATRGERGIRNKIRELFPMFLRERGESTDGRVAGFGT